MLITEKKKKKPCLMLHSEFYPAYESRLCRGRDKMDSWLSTLLFELSVGGGKSRTSGKQLYSGDGNKDEEEADGDRFISLGEPETWEALLISPKTLPGETYAESL